MNQHTRNQDSAFTASELFDGRAHEKPPRPCGSAYFMALGRDLRRRAARKGIAGRDSNVLHRLTGLEILELRAALSGGSDFSDSARVRRCMSRLGTSVVFSACYRAAKGRTYEALPMPGDEGFYERLRAERAKQRRAA